MKVEEIMTKNVIFAKVSDTLYDAIKKMDEYNISGLPVVDKSGKLVGIFSRTDVIKLLSKDNIEKFRSITLENFIKRRKKLVYLKNNESVEKAIRLLYKKKIDRLPVVNDEMKVVGIVSKTDIVRYLLDRLTKKEKEGISSLIDKVLEILDKEKQISIKELSKRLQVDEGTIERISYILEKNKIVEINYSISGAWIKKK